MSYLDDLKKNKSKYMDRFSNFNKNKGNAKERKVDDRFWIPTLDKAGNSFAVIRFLPPKDGTDSFPWVEEYKHNFNNPSNKRYVNELCPTLFKLKCPICEANGELWKAGNQAAVRGDNGKNTRKRIIKYISNVLIINDPANPENNGKVKLYRYGSQVLKKLIAAGEPEEGSGDPAIDVFNPFTGANFKLKIVKYQGNSSYNESSISIPSVIGTDEEIERILSELHDLKNLYKESDLKSYDELKKRLNFVLDIASDESKSSSDISEENDEDDGDSSESLASLAGFKDEPVKEAREEKEEEPSFSQQTVKSDEDQEVEDYFNKLANS